MCGPARAGGIDESSEQEEWWPAGETDGASGSGGSADDAEAGMGRSPNGSGLLQPLLAAAGTVPANEGGPQGGAQREGPLRAQSAPPRMGPQRAASAVAGQQVGEVTCIEEGDSGPGDDDPAARALHHQTSRASSKSQAIRKGLWLRMQAPVTFALGFTMPRVRRDRGGGACWGRGRGCLQTS